MTEETFAIRERILPSDRAKISTLLNGSGIFLPREMAYGMDLFDEHLMKGDLSQYRFIIYERGPQILGYGCYGAIRLSDRRYLLHWLAVDRNNLQHGLGRQIEDAITTRIRLLGGQRLYAQTSNRDYHDPARAFYEKCGYTRSAIVPDYYGDHDDMVLYVKNLAAPEQPR